MPGAERLWPAIPLGHAETQSHLAVDVSLVLLFMPLVGGAVACSGGRGGGIACRSVVTPGTTTGTYITVTATSGAITKTRTVTVTVH